MNIKKLNEELKKFTESAADKYLRVTYDGKEVDVYTITRYIGNIIPKNYDNSKLKAEIIDAQNLKEAVERYLSVEPCDGGFIPNTNIEYNAEIVLKEGDTVKDSIMIEYTNETDDEIRQIAKDYFDNITDDIRVQWY